MEELFTRQQQPIKFFIAPCAEKKALRAIIEQHGGELLHKFQPQCLRLAAKGTEIEEDQQPVYDIKFVIESSEQGKLLDLEPYRLSAPARQSPRSVEFSESDDASILRFINEHQLENYRQLPVWDRMQAEQVTGHSGARMRQRYLTHLQHRQTLQAHVASEDVVSEAGSGVSERKGRTKRSVGRPAVFTPTQSKQALHRKTTEPEEEDEVFEVEAIRDHEIRNGATFFFVKWKGYEESDNSWEPVEHLQASCVKLLAAYWKKHNEDASQEAVSPRKRKASEAEADLVPIDEHELSKSREQLLTLILKSGPDLLKGTDEVSACLHTISAYISKSQKFIKDAHALAAPLREATRDKSRFGK
eukprot:m.844644 g.844644  ORF g.844644 m.844644 type:complete len:359 (-) comp59545_c0_seq2:3073-4149(-)